MAMEEIVVSFTSYPKRVNCLDRVIESIVKQTVIPDKIRLYLAREQFRDEKDIAVLDSLESKYALNEFKIVWLDEDIRSHKKYYYAFQEYPDDVVITIDDDIVYKNTLVENFLKWHRKYPNCVIAGRTHLITMNKDGNIAPYAEWYSECSRYIGVPRLDLIATGCGGVLYPPHIFDSKIFCREKIINYCLNADDLWLKIMEVRNNINTILSDDEFYSNELIECCFDGLSQNENAAQGNDIQLKNILNSYENNMEIQRRIFNSDSIEVENLVEEREKDMNQALDAFLNIINKEEHFVIYGAGKVATKIYCLLEKHGYEKKIEAFIVEDIEKNVKELFGIQVRSHKDFIESNCKIIIGIIYYNQKEIYDVLVNEGIDINRVITLHKIETDALLNIYDWRGSADYWERRYMYGGNSGGGSYNRLAEFKAKILNEFVSQNKISSVIEWGCGDGNQLQLAKYPDYVGYDVSQKAIEICKSKFENDNTKEFYYCGNEDFTTGKKAELVLSLDVIYHLIEDESFKTYMDRLLESSTKYICIYSSDFQEVKDKHVKCRKFTKYFDDKKEWKLIKYVKNEYPYDENDTLNTSWSDFYFYEFQG